MNDVAAMSDRELDVRLGELIGLDVHRDMACWYTPEGETEFLTPGNLVYGEAEGTEHTYRPHPEEYPNQFDELLHYSTDLNAVREVEMRVLEMDYRPDPLIGSETEKPLPTMSRR